MALGLMDESKALTKLPIEQQQSQKGSTQSNVCSINDIKQRSQDDYCIFSLDEENAVKVEMPPVTENTSAATISAPVIQPQVQVNVE